MTLANVRATKPSSKEMYSKFKPKACFEPNFLMSLESRVSLSTLSSLASLASLASLVGS